MKIRRLVLIILFFNSVAFTLFSRNTISVGITSSYNSSNINFYNNFFPQNIRTNTISNYNFSFISEIKNSKNTGIRIEVSKLRRGWSENFNSQLINNEFDFLNIPIMMTTYIGEKDFKLNFSLGPYAEFQLDNNMNELKSLFPNKDFFFNDARDNSFGYGIKVSGGFSIDLNKSSFLFLVSYLYNFDNLIDVEQKTNLIPDISNLRTLSFSLVYLFNFRN
tara:strand:+ start:68 stop:727 length:660 start_codon:yes stop_codon:yes gene_type:complete